VLLTGTILAVTRKLAVALRCCARLVVNEPKQRTTTRKRLLVKRPSQYRYSRLGEFGLHGMNSTWRAIKKRRSDYKDAHG
jgi:hypothetical protein